MTQPRKPRQKRTAGGTRASRRNARESAWVLAKLEERFDRLAEIAEQARLQRARDALTGAYVFNPPLKEKTPGLAAEGFSSCFEEKER